MIGGGLTESSDEFRERFMNLVEATFRERVWDVQAEDLQIRYARDQDMAGCRGSALLARQYAQRHGL